MPNRSVEDYIKNIYKLHRDGERVTTSALAGHLGLSDASITDMVKKLSEKGYVRYERYRGVELTPAGRRVAMKIVRRHRLWEMFLVQFLGFSWDQIHEEAEVLEHVTSDELERALDKVLGFPVVDPHGDPIPTAGGHLLKCDDAALAECMPGDKVRINRVSDHDPQVLQYATKIGLGLNTRLVVKDRVNFDGSMIVKVGTKERFLSQQLARSIFVQDMP